MAKKRGSRRRYRKYLKGQVQVSHLLTSIQPKSLTGTQLGDSVTEKAWLSSIKCEWSLANWSPGVGDGPIVCGVAHSDYSDAEIEEWVENLGSWEAHDLIMQERSRRKIRQVAVIPTPGATSAAIVLNDGKPIHTKCGFMLGSGQTLRVWTYNRGTSALVDGAIMDVMGHANLWPA